MGPVCYLELKFSGPESPLGLVVESGHLESDWAANGMRAKNRIQGKRSKVSEQPRGGVEALGLVLLYRAVL